MPMALKKRRGSSTCVISLGKIEPLNFSAVADVVSSLPVLNLVDQPGFAIGMI